MLAHVQRASLEIDFMAPDRWTMPVYMIPPAINVYYKNLLSGTRS